MSGLQIIPVEQLPPALIADCVALLGSAFADPERYSSERIRHELGGGSGIFYRQFFVAIENEQVLGVAGVKAADWASDTHLLYLSAVTPERRGEGIGRALVKARLDWLEASFPSGRILVSSGKPRRFRSFGFQEIPDGSRQGKRLMLRNF